MNPETELWLFAVSVAASALGGMLGMASGIFIVPILTIFGHLDIRIAIGASIVSVIACWCGSAAPFLKERLTNVRLAIVPEIATTAGALSGVVLAGVIPTPYLFFIFGASASTYFVRGNIIVPIAGPVALGSVVGALLGARFLISISNDRIRLLFVAVLGALALQMFLAAFGHGVYRGTT